MLVRVAPRGNNDVAYILPTGFVMSLIPSNSGVDLVPSLVHSVAALVWRDEQNPLPSAKCKECPIFAQFWRLHVWSFLVQNR